VVRDEHAAILRRAIREGGGVEVGTEGDSFFAAFGNPVAAVRAAVAAQRGLAGHDWPMQLPLRVRMGLHTGEGVLGGDDYVGLDVNRAPLEFLAGFLGDPEAEARAHLPEDVAQRAWEEGRGMSADDAVAIMDPRRAGRARRVGPGPGS
jgi:hypothetical protein